MFYISLFWQKIFDTDYRAYFFSGNNRLPLCVCTYSVNETSFCLEVNCPLPSFLFLFTFDDWRRHKWTFYVISVFLEYLRYLTCNQKTNDLAWNWYTKYGTRRPPSKIDSFWTLKRNFIISENQLSIWISAYHSRISSCTYLASLAF